MNIRLVPILVAAIVSGTSAALAQTDIGKIEFESKCALCHGVGARGDGPLASYLNIRVADLTTLAKRNNGVLPVAAMYEIIEGGKDVPAHGSRDMPAWGPAFRMPRGERDGAYESEAFVRARILAIIEYVNRLQAK